MLEKLFRAAGVAVLSLLVLAARPALAEDSLSVYLGDKTPPLMNALNLVAEGAGFYKDEHLKVSTVLVDGSAKAIEYCSNGTADICPVGIEPVITREAEGLRLKMFLTRASKFGYVIAVLQDGPIKSLADLKGQKIGVHSITGASAVFATQSSLSGAGLTPADYTLVGTGMDDQAMAAFTSGKVAAAALPLYELIPYMVSGTRMRIFHHSTLGAFPNAGYAASPAVIAAKGEALSRFSRAVVKASLLIRYNPTAAARVLYLAQGEPFTEEDVRKKAADFGAWQDDLPASDPTSRRIGAFSITGMQRYSELLAEGGVTKAPVPASDVVTVEFIKFANDFDRKAFKKRALAMR
jgi:ABC-type nitrate/sulfonate/bicarbonate transport system substrate-binding protein